MKIADLLLDTDSEVSREAFVDFFNNKDTVKSQVTETTSDEVVVKTEDVDFSKNSLLNTTQTEVKISFHETEPRTTLKNENSVKDEIDVIFGSYTSTITLGRGRSSTINLGGSNRKVSRKHAIIFWEEASGAFTINVTGANGLCIDGAPCKAKCTKKLLNGNIIDVAGMKYRFQIPHLDYLPSPPFGSPAHITEAEQSTDTKSCLPNNNLLKAVNQTSKANPTNISKQAEKLQLNTTPKSTEPGSKAFRNISPVSSICNSSLKSGDDPIDGSSDLEFSSDSSDMELSELSELSDLESSEDSDASNISEQYTKIKSKKRGRKESDVQTKIDPAQKEFIDNIVAAIVFTGKHMISASEIYHTIMADHPGFFEKHQLSEVDIVRRLNQYPFFGHVARKGKDAGGKPLADLWYYTVNNDPDPERKDTYRPLVKGTRSCTLKDKQYYFKPPPKVPSIKYSTQQLPIGRKRSKRRKKTSESSK